MIDELKHLVRLAILTCLSACVLPAAFRPPAAPLIASDPYFSVWSMSDRLTDDTTRHWTGKPQPLSCLIRIDGVAYRLMGKDPSQASPLRQSSVTVHPTRTVYNFEGAGVEIEMAFATPLLLNDLDLFSQPVTYIRWRIASSDGKRHKAEVYFDVSALLAVDTPAENVSAGRLKIKANDVLRTGSVGQHILAKAGDDVRINWGYLYVTGPRATAMIVAHTNAVNRFVADGTLPPADDLGFPRPAGENDPALALGLHPGEIATAPATVYAVVAYDDLFSIEYMDRRLMPYWRRNGADAASLIDGALTNPETVFVKCRRFDESLEGDLERSGGKAYAALGSLAYRQGLAAQKLVVDPDGTPMLFPKENFSNGCIGTVDVLYPQAPQLLLFNSDLLKASITPVLEYAKLPRWRFPFAPHDLGAYPLANGQVYGGGEKTDRNQMPVEESANLILLVAAAVRSDATPAYAVKYWALLAKWADYLREKGLDPENQLCTDDFAGHLAHNVNLSAKAIEALGAYGDLCQRTGRREEGAKYRDLAEQFAKRWVQMADDDGHYRLTFDGPGTWSQKYNLVWDNLLGLHLFPKEVIRREVASYRPRLEKYGLPLDSRKTYTKLDWTFWAATLADSKTDFEYLIDPIYRWANETTSRIPMTDWYDTVSGEKQGFQARSVVGGIFIRLLSEPGAQKKWNAAARH